jgi:hypothetical protein
MSKPKEMLISSVTVSNFGSSRHFIQVLIYISYRAGRGAGRF